MLQRLVQSLQQEEGGVFEDRRVIIAGDFNDIDKDLTPSPKNIGYTAALKMIKEAKEFDLKVPLALTNSLSLSHHTYFLKFQTSHPLSSLPPTSLLFFQGLELVNSLSFQEDRNSMVSYPVLIDFILLDKKLLPSLQNVFIYKRWPSSHPNSNYITSQTVMENLLKEGVFPSDHWPVTVVLSILSSSSSSSSVAAASSSAT
jgi:hypothetical protein